MRRTDGGFTMVEMMFVVVVIGILSAIAVVAYTKNIRKVRSTEIVQMFGELKSKEEMYRAELGKYLPVCEGPTGPTDMDCAEDYGLWPNPLPGKGQIMNASALPPRWQALRVRTPSAGLYCQYEVVAGKATFRDPMLTVGTALFGSTAPLRNWYYVLGQCDWDDNTSVNAEYAQRDDSSQLGVDNEGR